MNVKSVSTIQAKQVLDATHYLYVSDSPVVIYDIEGEVSSTTGTNYYIQLIDTNAPTSGTTIPLYSRLVVPGTFATGVNGFSFVYRNGGINTTTMLNPAGGTVATTGANNRPVYVAISSTDNVYTSVAASTQVTVNYCEGGLEVLNQTITGDTITGVDSLAVFTDPNPTKKLTAFKVTNNNGATAYLMLFSIAAPVASVIPIRQWTIADGVTLTCSFGEGLAINSQDIDGTNHSGCYLFGSSTTGVLTATAATNWKMQAFNV